jgi:hypothetical protein
MDRALWWAFLQGEPQDVWYPEKRSKRQQKRIARQQMHGVDREDREPPFKKPRLDQSLSVELNTNQNSRQSVATSAETTTSPVEWNDDATEKTNVPGQSVVLTEEGEELEMATSSHEVGTSKHTQELDSNAMTPREVTLTLLSLLDQVSESYLPHELFINCVVEATSSTYPILHLLDQPSSSHR